MNIYILLVLALVAINTINAQNYHENDKNALRDFLCQGRNYSKLGLKVTDTINWKTSEAWVSKIKKIEWNNATPKRISQINWYNQELTGNLNLNACADIDKLYCNNNQLMSLSVNGCINIREIYCDNNQITILELGELICLVNLYCHDNRLKNLEIKGCTKLTNLYCGNNQLTKLNIDECIKLNTLNCYNNKLTTLGLSNYKNLTFVSCDSNKITNLSINDCINLMDLSCAANQLTNLDMKQCVKLTNLNCGNNRLANLNLNDCISLIDLSCKDNNLTNLDMKQCHQIINLNCQNNRLMDLNIGGCSKLMNLNCSNNLLTNLNLDDCAILTRLDCYNNQLMYCLDVNNFTNLIWLHCFNNQLTNLEANGCKNLKNLNCSNNQLVNLNINGCKLLERLDCSNNRLTNLNVSQSAALISLTCSNNQFKFSTLPLPKAQYITYDYVPQDTMYGGIINCTDWIDLSSEYSIDEAITSYTWYDITNSKESIILSGTDGKFILTPDLSDKKLICEMKNLNFPEFTGDAKLRYVTTIYPLPINVTQQPVGGTYGNVKVLSVTAVGKNLTYQWYKDNSAISGSTSASCQTTGVGEYFVEIANEKYQIASDKVYIIPKDVTVIALSGMSYEGESPDNPGLSAEVLVNNETMEVLTGLSNNFNITSTTPVGIYSLEAVGTLTNINYNVIERTEGTWEVKENVSIYEKPYTSLKIYPQPASDKITIDNYPNTMRKIKIYSLSGSLLYNYDVNRRNITLDISQLASGKYLLSIDENLFVFIVNK